MTSRLGSRLADTTVVILGAAGNLGPLWVSTALDEGAHVVACGLGVNADADLLALLESTSRLRLVECDITDSSLHAFDSIVEALDGSKIQGMVLSAGIDSIPGTGKQALTEYSPEEWSRVFQVNVFGVVNFLNKMIPHLASPSSVVTLGSLYGIVSPKPALYSHYFEGAGSIKHPAYGASKAALLALTKQYGTHLAPAGIRVNMLTLGGVAAGQDTDFVSKFENHVPQGHMIAKEELAGSLVYLLSSDSASMTAHNMVVDGGFTSW